MTKQELVCRIDKLNAQIIEAKRKYIDEHSPFKVGDTIELDGMQGIIESIFLSSTCDFEGMWRKYKKDGTLYANVTHLYSFQLSKAKLI